MSKFGVSIDKEKQLIALMESLDIREDDIEESFIRGSGKGGQKKNKTSSCVQLRHTLTNIIIRCETSRSQSINRFHARRELCAKIEEQILGEQSKRQQLFEKIRRQKRRRTRRQKEKILADKSETSKQKVLRRKIDTEQ